MEDIRAGNARSATPRPASPRRTPCCSTISQKAQNLQTLFQDNPDLFEEDQQFVDALSE